MPLEKKDLECIEGLIYKNCDDIAISIARSFERLEERMDAMESRLYSRICEIQDLLEADREESALDVIEARDDAHDVLNER